MKAASTVGAEATPALGVGAPVPGGWMAGDQLTSSSGGKLEEVAAGGKCIAGLSDKDLVDFLLNVQQEGNYSVTVQTACSGEGAHLEMLISGESVGTLSCPDTRRLACACGQHPPCSCISSPGQLTLRLRAIGKAPNIRMIRFDAAGGGSPR